MLALYEFSKRYANRTKNDLGGEETLPRPVSRSLILINCRQGNSIFVILGWTVVIIICMGE